MDKLGRSDLPTGRVILTMLEALACRGPDSAGVALIHDDLPSDAWTIRVKPEEPAVRERLEPLGRIEEWEPQGDTLRLQFFPEPSVAPQEVEQALGAARGGREVLCLGRRIDLVKQVGSPRQLEATYGVSQWRGPLAIGHTRLSTESRIDLSHSQPFWAHGLADVATVHNGHVTNYHQLRRHYEQRGVIFYTDNDSEVIGVYIRDRLERGRSFAEALADSVQNLDGAFSYLVVSPEGLGIVRDRFGLKPLMVAETDEFVAVATEEVALRRALPGSYRVSEPATGQATFYPLNAPALA
jgi:glutamine phosphoribosylpyrophosphate amidotransferase